MWDNWSTSASSSTKGTKGDNDTARAAAQDHDDHDIVGSCFPEDGRLVGTDAIFTSPNVVPHHASDTAPNPHKRMGVPTPSVFYDDRGEIHNIKANDRRVNILYTRAGYLRSGDLHPNDQLDFVFSGRVRIWTLQSDGTTKITTHGPHDFIRIPKAVPHVFEFVEDTVLAEWWEPQGFQAWFYKPYRDIVNARMGVERSSEGVPGRRRKNGFEILSPDGGWRAMCGLTLGASALGLAVGFALGRSGRR